MKFLRIIIATLLAAICTYTASLAGPFEFEFEEIAPSVWTGIRKESSLYPVVGNTTFVIGEKGVVVFDGGHVPAMAEQIIEKIRSITSAPVTHVIISHWHGDHNFGIFRFAEEFPNVQFVAHRFTDAAMQSAKIDYISGYASFTEKRLPNYVKQLETGKRLNGEPLDADRRKAFEGIVKHGAKIGSEFKRVKLTLPNVTFETNLTIKLGARKIELLYLGDGNTAGDIVMWLPSDKIVATGDLVVLPSPYAFNVPPRKWASTLSKLNALGYAKLVPGHGQTQTDTKYVDLIIETATSIADQRDTLIAQDVSHEDIKAKLDFSTFETRFTNNDAYRGIYYNIWFEGPLRSAAIKELSGEPMVKLEPRKNK